jgi:hypothetical protein
MKWVIKQMRADIPLKGTYTTSKVKGRRTQGGVKVYRELVAVTEKVARARYWSEKDGEKLPNCVRPGGRTVSTGKRNRDIFRLMLGGNSIGTRHHHREFCYIEVPTPGYEDSFKEFKAKYPEFFKENGGTGYVEMVRVTAANDTFTVPHKKSSMMA